VEVCRFTRYHCDYTWTTDYQVRYATDSEASPWAVH
jgi:hypothetical protein